MAWNVAVRAGDMTVKGMTSMWTALVRPNLEYGAEVLNTHTDFVWAEAEKLMRKVGRRVLKCGRRLPNDAILGELGWMSMRGRRMLLRLSYWRARVVKSAKLEDYVRWKHEPGLEEYLEHGDVPQRRLWTKLRGGCLELRVETGRWSD